MFYTKTKNIKMHQNMKFFIIFTPHSLVIEQEHFTLANKGKLIKKIRTYKIWRASFKYNFHINISLKYALMCDIYDN